jgi:8-oxo-dGTP pyrophosphatase MutT (NUDIX family)
MSRRVEQQTKNVFVPGLVRGAAHLAHAPEKAYAYVEDPDAGWRVYLRSAVFIHLAGVPFRADKFIVVKKFGKAAHAPVWEPPKGQMEGKDAGSKRETPVMDLLLENVRRETEEEAKIKNLLNVRHTGLVYQGREPDYPPNHYFQYHVFQAFVEPEDLQAAVNKFAWLHAHPKAWAAMRKDKREKDAIGWYRNGTGLMGRWSPSIVKLYLRANRPTV